MSRLVALVAFFASASVARADALPPDYEPPRCEPVSCLPGSVGGGGSHGSCPNVCVPWNQTCTADGECGGPGWICRPTRFCLEMRPAGRVVTNVVLAECAADGSCVEGTCTEASRCMPDPAGPPPAPPPATDPPAATTGGSGSSMCAIGHGGGRGTLGLVLLVAVVLRRRR